MKVLRTKTFTKWDETDNLKRAKDSDILAEEEKRRPGMGKVAGSAIGGGVAGAALGAGVHGSAYVTSKLAKKGSKAKKAADKILRTGKGKTKALVGAGAVAATAAAGALKRRHKEVEEVDHYNKRLKYAKRQALRREGKDWRNNMTGGREEYTY